MSYVALLRGVNVGGSGKLPMADLKRLCEDIGLAKVRTYIASGNVLFESALSESKAKNAIEKGLAELVGKPVAVFVRTAQEMAAVVSGNPFADKPGNRVAAIFLESAPPGNALEAASGRTDEECALGAREIYVFYPSGLGRSKLRIPAAKHGTARNMNSVAKLAELARTL